MGIRSRRDSARAEVRSYTASLRAPIGSHVPSTRVYTGTGTVPILRDVRATARPTVGNDWKPWHEARAIYRTTTGSRKATSAIRSQASPVRRAEVGRITHGSGATLGYIGNVD